MPILRSLTRAYLLNRVLRGGRRRSTRYPAPWGRYPPPRSGGYGPRARPRRRTGFFGPFPYYSTRTRGGSQVTVSGCCLPLTLGIVGVAGAALRQAMRR